MIIRILKKIATYLLVLLGLSILVFIISRVIPGDPARLALGPRTPEETVERLREEMHMNDSLYKQYYYWAKGALKGDLGTSLMTKRPVLEDVKIFLPATLELVFFSSIFMIIFGIILGVLSTKYSGKWPDGIIRVISYLGVVTPAFVWAIIIMLLFGYLIPILPIAGRIGMEFSQPTKVTGMFIIDFLLEGNTTGAKDAFMHIIMPAFVLSLGGLSQAARITRSTMTDNMGKDYVSAERAYGIPENKILYKYVLKPSLNPTVSVLALDIASLFGNAFLVEQIFNYPGISKYCMQAMLNKDIFVISTVIMILGIIFVIMNVLIDILISFLDPRIRLAGGSE